MRQFLLIVLFIGISGVKAQWNMEEIKTMELGQKFSDISQSLVDKFNGNAARLEGNVKGVYKIEAPEKDSAWIVKKLRPVFDAYGECQYNLKFANEVLVGIDIRFQFIATDNDKENFEQLLRAIDSNFSKDKDFFPLKVAGDNSKFSVDDIIQKVQTGCDSEAANPAYNKQTGFLGSRAWEVHKRVNNTPRHKLVTLQVYTSAMKSDLYNGCLTVVEIGITNEQFMEIYGKLGQMKIVYEPME